jgi:hypothetical protein
VKDGLTTTVVQTPAPAVAAPQSVTGAAGTGFTGGLPMGTGLGGTGTGSTGFGPGSAPAHPLTQ